MRASASRAFLLVLALAAARVHAAQEAGLPGAYLNYVGGAQVLGMGRAYTAVADGADAVAWNPAGLGFLKPNVLTLLRTQTSEEANLNYIGYAQPVYRLGGVGATFVRLDSGSLPETNEFNQEVGRFRDVEQAFMLGYGYAPVRRLSVGGTFKFVHQSLAGVSASGWGADLGALTELKYGLRVGARLQNAVAPSLKYDSSADRFPRVLTVGLGMRFWGDRLTATWDTDKALDAPQKLQWRLGVEGNIWQVAKLRLGFDVRQKVLAVGLGYLWGRSSFDYAMNHRDAGLSHMLGMTYTFGGYGVLLRAEPKMFSPMGLVKKTTFSIVINHSRPIYSWVLEIRNQAKDVIHSIRGNGAPPAELSWDGSAGYGMTVAPGYYSCTFSTTDTDGRTETTPPQVVRIEYGTPMDTLELKTR